MAASIFDHNLEKNAANYAPLTPLSFLERAAYVYPERVSVIHGAQRYTWAETYARCRRLASALAKFVLFDVAERGRAEPLRLRAGRWSFELFIKSTANRAPKLERTFEHTVERKHAEQFAADTPVYLINYEINLPAARRELAGTEWLPRGARYSN